MWDKIKDWFYHSEVIALGYFKILLGALLLSVHEIWNFIGQTLPDTDVKQALAAMNFPNYVTLGLTLLGALVIFLRMQGNVVTKDNYLKLVRRG